MKVNVVDQKGKKVEELNLNDSVFGIKPNMELVSQYVRVFTTNQRQGTSSTKTRAEVSGGGKKPWRQKGLGRARHGSTRSPLWVKGGITHGPKPRNWRLSFPKKMRQAAFRSLLSHKASSNKITVLSDLVLKSPSTKEISKVISDLGIKGKTLLILPQNNKVLVKSGNNLKNLEVTNVDILNVYEIAKNKNILILKDAVAKLQDKYANK